MKELLFWYFKMYIVTVPQHQYAGYYDSDHSLFLLLQAAPLPKRSGFYIFYLIKQNYINLLLFVLILLCCVCFSLKRGQILRMRILLPNKSPVS